jgi:hypothetical protein
VLAGRFYLFLARAWASVLAAAVFAAALVLPSRRTFEAALAAAGDVTSSGVLVCASALAAASFTALLDELRSAFEAALAAFFPVPFFISVPPAGCGARARFGRRVGDV